MKVQINHLPYRPINDLIDAINSSSSITESSLWELTLKPELLKERNDTKENDIPSTIPSGYKQDENSPGLIVRLIPLCENLGDNEIKSTVLLIR